ncbi:MAG: ribonuclease HII [Candidatus Atribacteria bacterium]|nr:ribonuclease HII [Candidatus Atribacteria bacterium]
MSNQALVRKILYLKKRVQFFYLERERVERIKYFEKVLKAEGFDRIAGIDEVGRGALAGPVVAAAVVFDKIDSIFIESLKDSKKIRKAKRESLFEIIKEKSSNIGIGVVSPKIIDKINIAQATFLAMKRAIMNLNILPDYILVDAFKIPHISIPQKNLIKGEDQSISIAAASIIAKVYRDRLMLKHHCEYPFYQFNHNVGYGTKNHLMAIQKYGICPLHRKTFRGVK